MNRTIGAIICAGLTWLGLQAELNAQNITIRVGGANRGAYVNGGFPVRQGNSFHNGVVFKPGNRLYGGVVYHGSPLRTSDRPGIVIYSSGNECCDCDRSSYQSRYYRRDYPYGYHRGRDVYYYRSRYLRSY